MARNDGAQALNNNTAANAKYAYGLSDKNLGKAIKSFYNKMTAAKLSNPEITRRWMMEKNGDLTKGGKIGDYFRFPVPGRLSGKKTKLDASQNFSDGSGLQTTEADHQDLYVTDLDMRFGEAIMLPFKTDSVEAALFIGHKELAQNGKMHMAEVLDLDVFEMMASGPSQFVPNMTSEFLNDPSTGENGHATSAQITDTSSGLTDVRFGELAGRFDNLGVTNMGSPPWMFSGAKGLQELRQEVQSHDITREGIAKAMMGRRYWGTLAGFRFGHSNNIPDHQCGDFEAAADISADWTTGGLRVAATTANGTKGGMTAAQFKAKIAAGTNAQDEWTIPLKGFKADNTPTAQAPKVLLRKGDVIRNYGRRKVGVDAGLFFEINQGNRGAVGSDYEAHWTVLEDVVATAAVAAATSYDVKLGWQGVYGDGSTSWRSIERQFKAEDLIVPVSGRPNATYRQYVGWQRDALALIFQNPHGRIDGGAPLPGNEARNEGYLKGANRAIIALSGTSSYHTEAILYKYKVWYAMRQIHPWWLVGRIMGRLKKAG